MSLSNAFTIEDLERARKYNGHLTRFCGLNEEPCNKCWDYATLIAQVRAEAQQAFFNNPNVQKVGRSIDARLAAAEKLSQVADSLIVDAEKAVNPRARLLYYDRLKEALAEWEAAK